MTHTYYLHHGSYITLNLRVCPNAKRNGFEGVWNNTHLKLALRAPAVDGKANEAVIEFLSDFFHLKKSEINIISGQTNRCKIIRLDSPDDNITERLTQLTK